MVVIEIDEEFGCFELINLVIIEKKGISIDVEGCLSILEIYGIVEWVDEVIVCYFDCEGEEMEVMVYGYLVWVF